MVLGGQQDQVNSIRVIKLMRIARTLRIVKTVTWIAQHFFFSRKSTKSLEQMIAIQDSCCKTQKHDEICIQSCGYSCMIAVYLSLSLYIYIFINVYVSFT